MSHTVLVTGGAGYIGSHACLELLRAGRDVVVIDNLSNASRVSLDRVRELAGCELVFHEADIRDRGALDGIFAAQRIDAVIHFAGLKAVGESVEQPLAYYDNNVAGTVTLLSAMRAAGVRDLVFSSSCTVYGDPAQVPVREDFPRSATNPYGRSKLIIEDMLFDLAASPLEEPWRVVLLRYFNPVGADASGRIGEDPAGIPNNLMPFVMQVAVGRRERVRVFGDDYPTPDGTGVRDYIHVTDLAVGHLAALDALAKTRGCVAVNLGTGRGYSVLDMIAAARRATGHPIPHEIVARRPGDIAATYADPAFAAEYLDWRAARDLDVMVRDHWRWQSANPTGYADASSDSRTVPR